MLEDLKIKTSQIDERTIGNPVSLNFQGTLRLEQQLAAGQLIQYDYGEHSASTAFGKTVIGAWLIAHRKVNTLIVLHRSQFRAGDSASQSQVYHRAVCTGHPPRWSSPDYFYAMRTRSLQGR